MRLTDFEIINQSTYDSPYGVVLIVGLLENGPVGQPFRLYNNKEFRAYLGDNPSTQAAIGLLRQGIPKENIAFYRLNGAYSKTEVFQGETKVFDIVAIEASQKQNDITVTYSEEGLTLQSHYTEESLSFDEQNYTRTYRYEDYPYTHDLANAINSDVVLGLIDVRAREYEDLPTQGLFPVLRTQLHSGDNELAYLNNPLLDEQAIQDYYTLFYTEVLGEGFENLTTSNIMDINNEVTLYPDVYIDEFKEIGSLASLIAQQKSIHSHIMSYALFHTKTVPPDDSDLDMEINGNPNIIIVDNGEGELVEIEEEVEPYFKPYERQQAFTDNLLELYTDDELTYDYYQHLMIAIGNEYEEAENNQSADIPLAASILLSTPFDGLSHKPIVNFVPENHLSQRMFARLLDKGYICIVPSIRKGYVFQKVQSMDKANDETILNQWANRRTLKYFEYRLNELFDQYIGRPISYIMPTSLRKELDELIEEFAISNRIKSGSIDVLEFMPMDSTIIIELNLTFYQEIEKVQTSSELKKEGWDLDIWNLPT